MRALLGPALIGIIAGILDVLPMIFQKMNTKTIVSAFLQYVFLGIIIINTKIPVLPWWLQGGLISLAFALPIIIILPEDNKKAAPIIGIMAIVIGTLISLAGHFAGHLIKRVI